MTQNPKEYTEELLKEVKDILYNNSIISSNETQMDYEECSRELALFYIRGLYRFGDSLGVREGLMFFNAIEKEIKKM